MPRIAYLLSHAMWSAPPMRRSRQMAGLRLAATGRAGPAGPDMCRPCSRPGVSVAGISKSPACGTSSWQDGWSVTGDDGRDWQSEPALGLMWQVRPEPARDVLGQGGHDDLVELVIGAHFVNGLQRAGASEIALDRDADRSKAGQHQAEALPGLRGRLLVGRGASVIRRPPPHAGLGEDAAGRHRVILRGFGVRDNHEEGTGPRTDPLAQLFPQLRPLQGLVRNNKISAHDNHPLQSIPRSRTLGPHGGSCRLPHPAPGAPGRRDRPGSLTGRVSVTLCDPHFATCRAIFVRRADWRVTAPSMVATNLGDPRA